MSTTLRPAKPGDGAILQTMVRELATHHGHGEEFRASPEDFERFLSDPQPVGGAIIALWEGEPAGCAIWHRSFSTFRGSETLYMEDISVLPAHRRKGIGRELLKAVARLALARKLPAVTWLMMGWNAEARRFYEEAGAEIEDGNCFCKLSGEALERLGS